MTGFGPELKRRESWKVFLWILTIVCCYRGLYLIDQNLIRVQLPLFSSKCVKCQPSLAASLSSKCVFFLPVVAWLNTLISGSIRLCFPPIASMLLHTNAFDYRNLPITSRGGHLYGRALLSLLPLSRSQ